MISVNSRKTLQLARRGRLPQIDDWWTTKYTFTGSRFMTHQIRLHYARMVAVVTFVNLQLVLFIVKFPISVQIYLYLNHFYSHKIIK